MPPTAVITFVRPIPTSTSFINLSRVSLVTLFLTSSTSVLPMSAESAKDIAESGSEFTVSLSVCGKSLVTGCVNLSPVNGSTVGATPELSTVR